MIANIIPEKRTSREKEIYSYLVPKTLEGKIRVGLLVLVPFGRKRVRAVVESVVERLEQEPEYKLKELAVVVEDFSLPPAYLRVIKWIADYYLCSLGEALSLFLPPEMARPRLSVKSSSPIQQEANALTSDQERIFRDIRAKLNQDEKKPVLLFGVTASGKTEVYLRAAAEVIAVGKQVIVLVPEIILTPQIVERFEANFGDRVAIVHSDLSKSEKLANFFDFYSGKKAVIIGPRSALLAPSQNLGMIIVDEEGEAAYKQEKNPKYQAVRLAREIARETNSLLLLGSATPTIESFYNARLGAYDFYELKSRFNQASLPEARILDMRQEIKNRNCSPISRLLYEEIEKALRAKRQVFLFLNRRGAATFVACRECGEVILCPHCSIPMVYHLGERSNFLNCHHCDWQMPVPYRCPVCRGYKIKYFGAGVEKIEAIASNLFPKAKIRRIDSKTFSKKADYHKLYRELKDGEIDILIGTQIIAKGLDIPSVDLVGIISADVGLHLPHFKADERTFQLLTQVSGRSGRGKNLGRTIIQTYWPESRSIQAAAKHNYYQFYNTEIAERKKFAFPPFVHLVRVVSEDRDQARAKAEIEKIAREAKKQAVEFLGPAKAFLSKLRGNYRYHLILKSKILPNPAITAVFKTNQYLFWDVDPENLL